MSDSTANVIEQRLAMRGRPVTGVRYPGYGLVRSDIGILRSDVLTLGRGPSDQLRSNECAICRTEYEGDSEILTHTENGCRNSFHSECLTSWPTPVTNIRYPTSRYPIKSTHELLDTLPEYIYKLTETVDYMMETRSWFCSDFPDTYEPLPSSDTGELTDWQEWILSYLREDLEDIAPGIESLVPGTIDRIINRFMNDFNVSPTLESLQAFQRATFEQSVISTDNLLYLEQRANAESFEYLRTEKIMRELYVDAFIEKADGEYEYDL